MTDQEFRDRCASAMGWEVIVVPYIGTKRDVLEDLRELGYPDEPIVIECDDYWTTVSARNWAQQIEDQGSSVGVYYGDPATQKIMFACNWSGPAIEFRPDESYDQAMMMRDKCIEVGGEFARGKFFGALSDIVQPQPPAHLSELLFATARQIAEAALKVLESKEASSARTQEGKRVGR